MNDLISRAEAIDALKRKQDDGKGDLSRFYNTIIQHDIEAIMQLPPIQPKLLQPWEVLAAQSVLSQPEPHWIPVTERLPAMGKSVLMCDIDGDIYLGHRTQCGYYYPDFCGDRVKNVTAWCNLPEPYKEVTT